MLGGRKRFDYTKDLAGQLAGRREDQCPRSTGVQPLAPRL